MGRDLPLHVCWIDVTSLRWCFWAFVLPFLNFVSLLYQRRAKNKQTETHTCPRARIEKFSTLILFLWDRLCGWSGLCALESVDGREGLHPKEKAGLAKARRGRVKVVPHALREAGDLAAGTGGIRVA